MNNHEENVRNRRCRIDARALYMAMESVETLVTLVIDEAAQAIELSSLIPLRSSTTQCVMVGDPQQLPPTVISPDVSLNIPGFAYNAYIS